MDAQANWQPKELQTRFLYPFFLREKTLDQTAGALVALRQEGRDSPVAIWEQITEPQVLYLDEALNTTVNFIFPGVADQHPHHCCRYFRVTENRANAWFRRNVMVRTRRGKNKVLQFPATLESRSGIELFLSDYGVGLLSIALTTTLAAWDETKIDLDALKRFNYQLAQFSRIPTVPQLLVPDGRFATHKQIGELTLASPDIENENAPLNERLGKTGCVFTLPELVEYLLSPLTEQTLQPTQKQFSVYTVARFDASIDFTRPDVRAGAAPLLAALAQIEEPTHAGALPGEPPDIANRIMNTRHWAGVAFLGAAHLIADQDPPIEFNEQRVPTVFQKYFIPYLMAFMQRLILHRFIDQAGQRVRTQEGAQAEDFQHLHDELQRFTITGNLTEVSSREALNRFYHMARQGLGVGEAHTVIVNAIHHYDADTLNDGLRQNMETVAHVQRKIEWLEVFFVSFYAAEMAHLISDAWFAKLYGHYSVVAWPVLALIAALIGLEPWKEHHRTNQTKRNVLFGLVIVLAVLWFVIGLLLFPMPGPGAAGDG